MAVIKKSFQKSFLINGTSRGFINVFNRRATGFCRQAKLYKLNFFVEKLSLGGQTRWAKSSSQLVNLPGALPLIKPLQSSCMEQVSVSTFKAHEYTMYIYINCLGKSSVPSIMALVHGHLSGPPYSISTWLITLSKIILLLSELTLKRYSINKTFSLLHCNTALQIF